jgi:hypothetical protein
MSRQAEDVGRDQGMVVEQAERHLVEDRLDRPDLGRDIDAEV